MTRAVVTGASSGIGWEFAQILASEKYALTLVARRQDKLEQLAQQIQKDHQTEVDIIAMDLARQRAGAELYEELNRRGHDCEVLINNAGFGQLGSFKDIPWSTEEAMIQLNVMTMAELSHLFVKDRLAKNQQGNLLNVASTAAFQPGPLMAVYYATKAFVLSFSEAIAEELDDTAINVTTLCPGPTKSEFQERANMGAKLFNSQLIPDSRAVAEYGYKAMRSGKRLAVHGQLNRLGVQSLRFMPRRLITNVVRRLSESVRA
jgi:hypothetical protein